MNDYNQKIISILKDYWGENSVMSLPTEISDFIITYSPINMKFAVKCMDASVSDQEVNGYKAKVSNSIMYRGAPRIPVVIIKIDRFTSAAQLGIVLYYQYGTPSVVTSIQFMPMNEEKRDKVLDEIKAADLSIRVLEKANCKVIKTLKLPIRVGDNEYFARMVYARDLSMSYQMTEHKEMSDIERFNYNLNGIPEDDFPKDALDIGMLNTVVQEGFLDASFESHLLIFNTDLQKLKKVYDRPSERVCFQVNPDCSSLSVIPRNLKLTSFYVDMFILRDDHGRFFSKRDYSINLPITDLNDYYDFVDGIKTLIPIKDYLLL